MQDMFRMSSFYDTSQSLRLGCHKVQRGVCNCQADKALVKAEYRC